MNHLKSFLLVLCFVVFASKSNSQQTDGNSDSRYEVPGGWGMTEMERNAPEIHQNNVNMPQDLIQQYIQAKSNKNESEKIRLGSMIQEYLQQQDEPVTNSMQSQFSAEMSSNFNNPPFQQDWYTNDVQVHSGSVGATGTSFRRIDLKQGEDGWMYMCVGRTGILGSYDGITVYMSTNNGATWPYYLTLTFSSWKLFTLSMLVENRSSSNSNPDSTRILVYFTTAPTSSGDDAQLWVWSTRRNGTAGFNQAVGVPPAGHKYEYVSACSDGKYYTTATFMHSVVREATNAGTQAGIRHFYSTNWASSHSNVLINTGWNDYYPSIQYGEKNGSDSIYIAVERRFSATDYDIRVIATPEVPNTNTFTYYITSGTNIKYEKPCLTVVQQHFSVAKKMVVTCTRNNIARYHYSTNGGTTWTTDQNLTSVGLRDFTWCSSDSNTTNGGYIMMCTVDQNGDSVTVRRGSITNMGGYIYKKNSIMSTGLLAPVCAIINENGTLSSALGYAGQGPSNAYFNGEALVTGIQPIGNTVPDNFSLSQNYPNPFNPVTNINFSIPKSGIVKLAVYDITGKEIAVLVNGSLNAGTYKYDFDASHLSSGTYFYRINADNYSEVKKMVLVK